MDLQAIPEKLEERVDGYVFDSELSDFIAGGDTAEYSALLYRYNEADGDGKRRVQIWKYYNEIPDSHQLGLIFGGGRYLLVVSGQSRKGDRVFKSFNLRLGKNYDELSAQTKKAQNIAAIGAPVQAVINGGKELDVMQIMNFALTLVEKVTKLQAPVAQPAPLPEAVLSNVYNHFQRLMFTQARDTQRMIHDMREREGQPVEEPEGDGAGNNGDFALKIIELIKGVLPALLNPVAAKVAVQVAKKSQEFQRIKGDPRLQEEVIDGLKREVGEKNTERIVEEFGIGSKKVLKVPNTLKVPNVSRGRK